MQNSALRRKNIGSVNTLQQRNLSMPGSSYHPLESESDKGEKSEVERFREAAGNSPPRDELIALVAIDTGLRNSAIAHMTEHWVDKSGSVITIDVPQYQKCTLGTGNSGRGGDTTKSGAPCSQCKNRNTNQDWLPAQQKLPNHGNCWRPKSKNGYKGREIPIKEPDTAQIVTSWFKVHEKVVGRAGINAAVKRVADKAGLLEKSVDDDGEVHYWPTSHDLRDTFGTRLALKGFTRDEIRSAMGHASIHQADDYVQFSGRETQQAFDEKW